MRLLLSILFVALAHATPRPANAQVDEVPALGGSWDACFEIDSLPQQSVIGLPTLRWPVCGRLTFAPKGVCGASLIYNLPFDSGATRFTEAPRTVALRIAPSAIAPATDSLTFQFGGFLVADPADGSAPARCRLSGDDGSLSGTGWLTGLGIQGVWTLSGYGTPTRLGTFRARAATGS